MREIVIRKTIILSVIGIMVLLIGLVYGISGNDKTIIILSTIICAANICKVVSLNRIYKENRYTVITGKCLETEFKMVGRYRLVRIQNNNEFIEISVPKNVRLKPNREYNLYFKNNSLITADCGEWLRNKVLSENFIGYEFINSE